METPARPAEEPERQASLPAMVLCGGLPDGTLTGLLAPFGLEVCRLGDGAPIPGSYWGAPEAGLVGSRLFVRDDTPVHSALHEACHFLCMDGTRRAVLDTDAGGEDIEESAVCYLQVLLAEDLPGVGGERLCRDMDAWGYSFRLGSTGRWFEDDAEDARRWLVETGMIDETGRVLGRRS